MKTLNSEYRGAFQSLQKSGLRPFYTMTPAEAREAYEKIVKAKAERSPGPEASVTHAAARGPFGEIPLVIFRPSGLPAGPAPALVFFHGGGWVVGSPRTHAGLCRRIAAAARCLVISVGYRLAPEFRMPASSYEACAALRWISAHADEIGADPKALAVGGDSAGGCLAAAAAIEMRDKGVPLAAQVLLYPATDNRPSARSLSSRGAYANIPPLTKALSEWFHENAFGADTDLGDWHVSPAAADTLRDVAPALIITAEMDVRHDEARLYAQRLDASGVAVTWSNFSGVPHAFLEMHQFRAAKEAVELTGFFLRSRFAEALESASAA